MEIYDNSSSKNYSIEKGTIIKETSDDETSYYLVIYDNSCSDYAILDLESHIITSGFYSTIEELLKACFCDSVYTIINTDKYYLTIDE